VRIVLITGKGGVGKTTVAAATAAQAAAGGLRTVVLSTDPAHSLADAFDVPLGDDVTPIAPNLSGQQLDARARFERSWGDIREYLVELFDFAGMGAVEAEELAVIPGLDEVFALADIKAHATSGDWDLIVVDCAPTAETLRLLSLPDVLAWYMDRVFGAQRVATRLARPLLRRATDLPIAADGVFAAIRRFYDRLAGVREILTDGAVTSARIVVTPERMVIAEARRVATYLSLFGYHVDAVVANRLIPDAVADPWFTRWKATQSAHLSDVVDAFAPVPLLRAELEPDEVVGVSALETFGARLYAGTSGAATVLHQGTPLRVTAAGERLVLSVALPFTARDDVEVAEREGELFIAVGPHRRVITLPDSLARRDVVAARLRGEVLEVEFDEPLLEPVP
jgi:arsenite-transporting ATPase